ncbi:MAG: hypothetical protein VXW57_09140, partial [Pseudomonadota bacterium]|nr:hypothetical protein [Pseudomonadota bacterium]
GGRPMARCKYCDESGWFLQVNSHGLCVKCQIEVGSDIDQRVRIVLESIGIAKKSKNISTAISRLNLAAGHCDVLQEYYRKGLPTLTVPPVEVAADLRSEVTRLVGQAINDQRFAARQKAEDAAGDAAKLGGYAKAISVLTKLMDDVSDVTEIETAIEALRQERDGLRFDLIGRKAEVAAAKGQTKKAVGLWIDAIMALRHDSTPDAMQSDRIATAEEKIRELGGEPPAG